MMRARGQETPKATHDPESIFSREKPGRPGPWIPDMPDGIPG